MTGAGSARLSFARRGEERHRRASDHCAWCAESGRSQEAGYAKSLLPSSEHSAQRL